MTNSEKTRILYVSNSNHLDIDLPEVFRGELERQGKLEIMTNGEVTGEQLTEAVRNTDVWLTCRHSVSIPPEVANDPGRLKLVVAVVGSLRPYVPEEVIASPVAVCNWGDAPANEIAVGTLTLLLAVLADLHHHVAERRRGGWKLDRSTHGGSIWNERVGLYGYGLIARRFRELIRPFGCRVIAYDPFVSELPDDVERAQSIDELFRSCRVVSIHAGLTEETRGSVGSRQLELLSDDGVVINTGRGAIIDQKALFAELSTGRIRAGLDVLDGSDQLPPEHPARSWENLILTGHQIHLGWPLHGRPPMAMTRAQQYAVQNITALRNEEPLQWVVDGSMFRRMT